MSSNPWNPRKKLGMVTGARNPRDSEWQAEAGDPLGLIGYKPAPRFSERRCLKGIMHEVLKQGTLHLPVSSVHTQACMYVRLFIYIHIPHTHIHANLHPQLC